MKALLLTLVLLSGGGMSETPSQAPVAVHGHWVLAVMRRALPQNDITVFQTYDEIAEAIALASNDDPVFDGPEGPMKTASLLLAIAFYESRFNPRAIGDHGESFGLFQIQVPTARLVVPDAVANTLLLPRTAAPVATALIRLSKLQCRGYGWDAQLGWYGQGGPGCGAAGRRATRPHMLMASKIIEEELSSGLLLKE